MQVNPLAPAGRTSAGDARTTLLPQLIQLLQRSATEQVRHDDNVRQRETRLRRRDDEIQQQVAAAAGAPRPSDELKAAEREQRPGTPAARAEQRQAQLRQQTGERTVGFRHALTHVVEPGPSTPDPQRVTPGHGGTPAAVVNSSKGAPTSAGQPAKGMDPFAAGQSQRTPASAPGPTRPAPPALAAAAPGMATHSATAAREQMVGSAGKSAVTAVTASTRATTAGVTAAPRAASSAAVAAAPSAPGAARKATGATAAPPEAGETTRNPDVNIERILRLVHSRIGQERSVATLRLDPPELGTVRVHMDLRKENLSLRIETQTPAAQRLLHEQVETLRQGLEASGIYLDRIEIRAPEAGDGPDSQPQPSDVPFGHDQASAQRDTGSAGGGAHGGTDSPAGDWSAEEAPAVGREWIVEPATESRVNLWA
ncbi:MAG: flagellar hook-length control protein FliK [Planctomycetota bacterium]